MPSGDSYRRRSVHAGLNSTWYVCYAVRWVSVWRRVSIKQGSTPTGPSSTSAGQSSSASAAATHGTHHGLRHFTYMLPSLLRVMITCFFFPYHCHGCWYVATIAIAAGTFLPLPWLLVLSCRVFPRLALLSDVCYCYALSLCALCIRSSSRSIVDSAMHTTVTMLALLSTPSPQT